MVLEHAFRDPRARWHTYWPPRIASPKFIFAEKLFEKINLKDYAYTCTSKIDAEINIDILNTLSVKNF